MVLRFRGLLLTVPFQAEVSARTMETQFLFVQIGSISGGKEKIGNGSLSKRTLITMSLSYKWALFAN